MIIIVILGGMGLGLFTGYFLTKNWVEGKPNEEKD
jgi:hypothetical protein